MVSRGAHALVVAVFCLAAASSHGADLAIQDWNLKPTNGTFAGWVKVSNRTAGGNSGSIQIEVRLGTAPHGQGGQFYTLYRDKGSPGLPGGYNKSVTVSGPYNPSAYRAGQYYFTVCAHEYMQQGWVNRTCRTSNTLFTVAAAPRPVAPAAPARPKPADMKLGEWGWKINNGQASGQAKIFNYGGVRSGTLRLELRLCDEPFGDGGGCYSIATSGNAQPLDGGYNRTNTFVGPFNANKYEDGNYYVVLVLKEYTGEGQDGYVVRSGATSTTMFRIGEEEDEEEDEDEEDDDGDGPSR